MFFTVKAPSINRKNFNSWILKGANLVIASYNLTPSTKPLEAFLQKNYGLSIKAACMVVLANSKFQKNKNNEILIVFPTKRINDLAAIITYGTGRIQGCPILTKAFGRD